MYYFDKTLIEKAFELLNEVKDLTDIAKDVFKIQHVLDYWSFYTLEEMSNLNQEMEEKYPEIFVFQRLADSVKWKLSSGSVSSQNILPELEKLKFDFYYLLVLTLKNAGEIVELYEFFDKNYIVNY